MGVIPLHGKKINPSEANECIKNHEDPTRDSQREANSRLRDDTLFDDRNIPSNSWATMSEDDMKKHDAAIAEMMKSLQEESSDAENNSRPGLDANAKEWNTFKIKQQGLNYEIDRKVKEKQLMYIDEFKATLEIVLGPLNQSLDDFAFDLKSQFPDILDEVILWVLNRTNQMKVDVQNVSV